MRNNTMMCVIALVGATALLACGDRREAERETSLAEVKDEAREAVAATARYTRQQMEKLRVEAETELERFDEKLERLADRARNSDGYEETLAELKRQRVAAERRLDELSAASGEAWRDAKERLEASLAELEAAYDRAVARLDEGRQPDGGAG